MDEVNRSSLVKSTITSLHNTLLEPTSLVPYIKSRNLTFSSKIRIFIYITSFILSVTGNTGIISLTLYNIYKKRSISAFCCLITQLALTDLLFSFNAIYLIPVEINGGESFQNIHECKIIQLSREIPFMASIGTIVVIAIERYEI